jgi:cell division cycle 2-like protein
MSAKSRWANEDPETEAIIAQQKREKEEKRRAKAEKQRQLEASKAQAQQDADSHPPNGEPGPPKKRRRLSNDPDATSDHAMIAKIDQEQKKQPTLLRFPVGEWGPCRHVDNFEKLNHIEEGSYGWVSRAKDISTGEIVALKKLKLENSPDGFPVTGLREIQTLMEARHQNVVYLREVVMGNKMDE